MNNGDTLAPELAEGLTWLNSRPLALSSMEGKVVALVFWSAGSAWSHTLLQRLGQIQMRFPREIQVIGVHTPKFDAERGTALVRRVAAALSLPFPLVHDPDFVVWQHYGAKAWPSIALVDPQGQLRALVEGEHGLDALEDILRPMFAEVPAGNSKPAEVSDVLPSSVLLQPSGLAVGERLLYIADSGHHRVIECDHGGRVQRVFGSGIADLTDGALGDAAMRMPGGLALGRELLYVADTGNHALRRVRLDRGEVDTLLGNGRAGPTQAGIVGEPGAVQLDRPSGLALAPDRMYLAQAGANQVWEYHLSEHRLRCLAGSGEMGLADGTGEQAAFAQPTALALVQQTLYVADAAGSALRSVHTGTGSVHLLVGKGLFEFGDVDGKRGEALLQYPTGLALDPDSPWLWIADAYNGKLRRLKLGGGGVASVALAVELNQPVALATGAGAMWALDACGDGVVRIDLASGEASRITISE